MAETPPQWIIVPNWDKFQNFTDRVPTWIKLYLELRDKDEWRTLTYAQRGLLVSLWLEYGAARGVLGVRLLSQKTGQRDTHGTLEALNHAGFIEFSTTKPAATRAREKKERREEKKARARAPASDERPRAPAEDKNTGPDAALADAFAVAADWAGGDTDAFERKLDQIARSHDTKISFLDRAKLWDIAFGDHQQ